VELTGVRHERQRLLFAGHALQDDQRLHDRGVRDGHTIHLVERPEGATGGPPPPEGVACDAYKSTM
jgi:Ubiquitin family